MDGLKEIVVMLAAGHCIACQCCAPPLQGTRRCDFTGWQAPVVVLALVLAAAPVVTAVLAQWSSPPVNKARHDGDASPLRHDLRLGVRRALASTYRPGLRWWESVLMLQRLLLAAVVTFSFTTASLRALVAAALCVSSLCLHLLLSPLRDAWSHGLQTALLLCLCVIAMVGVVFACERELGAMTVVGDATLRAVDAAFSTWLPLACVCCAVCGPAVVSYLRRRCRRRSVL